MELGEFGSGKTGTINYFFLKEVADKAKDERAEGEAQTWKEFTEKRKWKARRRKGQQSGSLRRDA